VAARTLTWYLLPGCKPAEKNKLLSQTEDYPSTSGDLLRILPKKISENST
jgi:hypothetical protein